MHMKRTLGILGVGLALLLSITGCGKEKLEDYDNNNVTQNPITDTYSVAAEELFPHRTAPFIDTATVDAMMEKLRFPDTFSYREAEAADGSITIVFDTNSDDRSLYVGEEYQWPFYKSALYVFSLVENAEQVIFHIYDEASTPLEIVYGRDQALSVMGDDFFTNGETSEGYAALIKVIDDSFDSWDLTIPE